MSDNSQPVSSRRALREKRRAEMEALLANNKAEQAAKEQASAQQQSVAGKKPVPADKAEAKPDVQKKPAAAEASAKPASKQPTAPAASKAEAKAPAKTEPAKKPEPAKPEAAKPAPAKAEPAKQAPAKTEASKQDDAKAAPKPPAAGQAGGERASLRRARDREALRERRRLEEEVGALTSHIPTVEPADDPKPLTRRQLRLQALAEQGKAEAPAKTAQPSKTTKKPATPAGSDQSPETTVMSVEDALAARRAHTPPVPVDPNLIGEDDSEIDLEVLAHQREMAARAAIISRRAAERERLRVQNAKQGKDDAASDPFTGALGNIREAEDRIAKTGVAGPKTESVSLSFASPDKNAAKPAAKQEPKPAPKPASKAPAKPAVKPAAKPDAKPAAAEKTPAKPAPKSVAAAAESNDSAVVDMPRIDAVNAQGLQPLDVQTHGVRRANNMLIAMIVALGIGAAALIAGLIMLFSN
ncbi:hypothetical protein AUR04nite_18820 [Glutamicibacter uratoxydans]|uniref:Uncharacterized protein n=1 Tax=Glutamicibacter uratoxydans TaxID=43667 RepID=A0A4Y4DS41_GLUUR|nr:hypothetical protein [Glutamicibacter uratoxydans]GED06350.1 hypothetical protein AUR04nite_18820 [Glutamicibacter uratoxydans]